jgi:hypothetical protein
MKYDLVIVPGSHPDPKTWKFPEHIYKCLERAAALFDKKQAPLLATSGKWAISFDNKGIKSHLGSVTQWPTT